MVESRPYVRTIKLYIVATPRLFKRPGNLSNFDSLTTEVIIQPDKDLLTLV